MYNIGIVGLGYTGLELIKLILNHPQMNLTYLSASKEAVVEETFPSLSGVFNFDIEVFDASEVAKRCDLVFLALPHKVAMEYAKELLKFDIKIVDLSADYRLKLENYEAFYTKHLDKESLKHAVYGLPELFRRDIKKARLIANPGCYPTCSILAIAPFLKYINLDNAIFIDAKSGLSGAGKGLKESSHFVSVNENMNAYSPITHRHSIEVSEKLTLLAGDTAKVLFIPHLVPLTRGMLVSAFVSLKEEIEPLEILREFYKDEEFIRVRDESVHIKNVAGTHFIDIYAKSDGLNLWINASIDNLLRGASSQALANANLMLGLDESLGLPKFAHGL
ncbi:MAG: N-acetyl-gamma-glutamyl-phosphate reductase [Campylobacteraceae bacterium]|nr:N-acetyl-gamma-glutamyl-phosphate reductase [Campylobacteraceae bacterium]